MKKVPYLKIEGGGLGFNVIKLPPPLNLRGRGSYQFPTLLNT